MFSIIWFNTVSLSHLSYKYHFSLKKKSRCSCSEVVITITLCCVCSNLARCLCFLILEWLSTCSTVNILLKQLKIFNALCARQLTISQEKCKNYRIFCHYMVMVWDLFVRNASEIKCTCIISFVFSQLNLHRI